MAKKVKLTREELKRNELKEYISEFIVKTKEFWNKYSRQVIYGIIGVVIVYFLIYGLRTRRETMELEAFGRYRQAIDLENKGKDVNVIENLEYIIKNYKGTFVYGQAVLKMASKFIEKGDPDNAIKILNIGLKSGDLTKDEKIKAEYMMIIAEELNSNDKEKIIQNLIDFINKYEESSIISEAKLRLGDLYRETNKVEEAEKIYQEFVDKGEEAFFYEEAKFRLILLKSQQLLIEE
ncbi:MAG: tetratricopeptide repeat protein [Candidatus Hydrogenedentota bacterium]